MLRLFRPAAAHTTVVVHSVAFVLDKEVEEEAVLMLFWDNEHHHVEKTTRVN